MPLGMDVALDPGDFLFDRSPAPPEKNGTAHTQFLAHACCDQTAEWIEMSHDTEVGLGPGDIVLDRDPAPP